MKRSLLYCFFFFISYSLVAQADHLDNITRTGIVRIAVYNETPPLSYLDSKTDTRVGYEIDIANAIAKGLGVKPKFVITTPENRVSLLTSKKVDLVIASFTITDERSKLINFSIPYFSTGQKFIARKGALKQPQDLVNLRVGVGKGTVHEATLRKKYPMVKIVLYADIPFAFAALRNGNVQAITQDDVKLVGLLANTSKVQKASFEISPFSITQEYQGIGIIKDEQRLTQQINEILLSLEKSGEAEKIYERWFGAKSATAMPAGNRYSIH